MLKASLKRMVALQALIVNELLNPVADFAATGGGYLRGGRCTSSSMARYLEGKFRRSILSGFPNPRNNKTRTRRVLSMLRIGGPEEAEKLSHLINLYKE